MELSPESLDELVLDIVQDIDGNGSVQKATRHDINTRVLEHLTKHVADYVLPTLDRLIADGRIINGRDFATQGSPWRYYLPRSGERSDPQNIE